MGCKQSTQAYEPYSMDGHQYLSQRGFEQQKSQRGFTQQQQPPLPQYVSQRGLMQSNVEDPRDRFRNNYQRNSLLDFADKPSGPTMVKGPSESRLTVDVDANIDWSAYEDVLPALRSIQTTHFIEAHELSIIRALTSNYMKTEMASWNGESVLIKYIDTMASAAEVTKSKKALVSEITAMARIQHPNIVEFKGFSISNDKGIICVTEFMEAKTLRTLLDDKRKFDRLTWAHDKINFAIDICSALAYMHNLKPRLIHRSVKASKVLLSKDRKQAKLSGFGSSRDRSFEQEMTNKIGEIEWSAPELIMDDEDYTEKVDVYSFGILLVELDTGLLPFADIKDSMPSAAFTNRLISGVLRPKLTPECPPVMALIVKACLQSDVHIRPTSAKVLEMLEDAKAVLLAASDDVPPVY
ncbi:Aste57867_19712 [Aphanomyces stellatus]|uniref:Aste57867_19712 protein n=1 Tax=Aphanomyces stellatus TaxID=120398 RepID=A0A485LD20_9STRA|nr:hypothetical protein As57867_019647 [Aphanomyces stellatus]VFT96411.1 Aste57867_19712 [Aphanomyces stellatus]